MPDSVPREFPSTHWSLIAAAGESSSNEADAALAELCGRYWYPIYAFVRRRGRPVEDARDLTQDFFAALLDKGYLADADPDTKYRLLVDTVVDLDRIELEIHTFGRLSPYITEP